VLPSAAAGDFSAFPATSPLSFFSFLPTAFYCCLGKFKVANAFGQLLSAAPTLNADPRPLPKMKMRKTHTHTSTTGKKIKRDCCLVLRKKIIKTTKRRREK